MTDRELLEYAAKAAGIPLRDLDDHWDNWEPEPVRIHRGWNPIEYDGDALRLAVKCLPFHTLQYSREDYDYCQQDPYAATRRAIVRAAAEIGKDMDI